MYHIFCCRFPAKQEASLEQVANALGEWIRKSEYHPMLSISVDEFLRQPLPAYIRKKGENEDEALLERIRWTDGKTSCFGLCQTIPPQAEKDNLIWQSGCIFEQKGDASDILVFLNRGIPEPTKKASLNITPRLPGIIKYLKDKNLIVDATVSSEENSCFPTICIREDIARGKSMLRKLKYERLDSISHIKLVDKEQLPSKTDLLLYFPSFGICHSYARNPSTSQNEELYQGITIERFFLSPNLETSVSALSWDIFRIVSETQRLSQRTWDQLRILCPEDQELSVASSEKCLIKAELLRQKRKESGLSQKELGQRAGSSGLVVSRLETNHVLKASRSLVRNLEKVLCLSENSLIADTAGAIVPETPEMSLKTIPLEKPPGDSFMKMKYCRRCGTKLYQDSLFCHSCGTEVPT